MTKGWDHDPPAKNKLVPFGVLILAMGALTLLFGSHETSDFWATASASGGVGSAANSPKRDAWRFIWTTVQRTLGDEHSFSNR